MQFLGNNNFCCEGAAFLVQPLRQFRNMTALQVLDIRCESAPCEHDKLLELYSHCEVFVYYPPIHGFSACMCDAFGFSLYKHRFLTPKLRLCFQL